MLQGVLRDKQDGNFMRFFVKEEFEIQKRQTELKLSNLVRWYTLLESWYCAISINLAGPVTRYTPAEILVLALWPGHRYIAQKIR